MTKDFKHLTKADIERVLIEHEPSESASEMDKTAWVLASALHGASGPMNGVLVMMAAHMAMLAELDPNAVMDRALVMHRSLLDSLHAENLLKGELT